MPFLQVDQTGDPLGKIGSALPPATLVVQPDQVLRLKHRLEARREQLREFMRYRKQDLVNVPPPGTDPCSARTVEALGRNGQSALDAAQGFLDELGAVVASLDEAVRLYSLTEESNADRLRQVQE
jgi:hypothetical protein